MKIVKTVSPETSRTTRSEAAVNATVIDSRATLTMKSAELKALEARNLPICAHTRKKDPNVELYMAIMLDTENI